MGLVSGKSGGGGGIEACTSEREDYRIKTSLCEVVVVAVVVVAVAVAVAVAM